MISNDSCSSFEEESLGDGKAPKGPINLLNLNQKKLDCVKNGNF